MNNQPEHLDLFPPETEKLRCQGLENKNNEHATMVCLLGDSTIDNAYWVASKLPWKFDWDGTKHDTPYWIHQTLKEQTKNPITLNCAVDCATSTEVNDGLLMHKIFRYWGQSNTHPNHRMGKLQHIIPRLRDNFIHQKRVYVLSVGGNDFREDLLETILSGANPLQSLFGITPEPLKANIRQQMPTLIKSIAKNVAQAIQTIKEKDPEATIILSSQYFPDCAHEWPYFIYTAFRHIAHSMGYKNAKDALHQTLRNLYLEELSIRIRNIYRDENKKKANLFMLDITQAIPSKGHHTHQIELNRKGAKLAGQVIAKAITAISELKKPVEACIQMIKVDHPEDQEKNINIQTFDEARGDPNAFLPYDVQPKNPEPPRKGII